MAARQGVAALAILIVDDLAVAVCDGGASAAHPLARANPDRAENSHALTALRLIFGQMSAEGTAGQGVADQEDLFGRNLQTDKDVEDEHQSFDQ